MDVRLFDQREKLRCEITSCAWGFHLIKVVEKKEKGTTFEEIIPAIHRAIDVEKGRKHIADWEENLLDEANVWINQKLLKQLALPKPEG